MKVPLALLTLPLLLVGAAERAPDRFATLLAEYRQSREAGYGCFKKELVQGTGDADAVVASYARRHGFRSETGVRVLLANLVEYVLRPSDATFAQLNQTAGESADAVPAADAVCHCIYYSGEGDERPARMEVVNPAGVGLFWAGRVRHEKGQPREALEDYRRALEADPASSRTRLLYGIALVQQRRAQEALKLLEGIPRDWGRKPVAYWRARALFDTGDAAAALRLLEPIRKGWGDEPTVPGSWFTSTPVQPSSPPVCLLGLALDAIGHKAKARALLTKEHDCAAELGHLELQSGRAFEALLSLHGDFGGSTEVLDALLQLKACDWARQEIDDWKGWRCRPDSPSENCDLVPELIAKVATACPAPDTAAGTLDAALAARLNEPRRVPFEERPVPAELRTPNKTPDDPIAPKQYPALKEITIVAIAPAAPRMWAVSVSQDVDPRGEVSRGGYWLHLSADNGKSWDGPYYLGFAQQFPYVVQAATRMPPFDGERINVEVERREVDTSSITFPPVALRAKSVEPDLYLSIDIASVRRDADGDGLTDLLEEKLALDPGARDTDGDGLADGVDPLPLQPRREPAASSDRDELLRLLLPIVQGGASPIQQSAAGSDEGSSMSVQSRPFASARTLFVSGRGDLPHTSRIRTITLSPEMRAEYERKFGPTYPLSLPNIAFDPAHQRAFIEYSHGWAGGTMLAKKDKSGHWTLTPRSHWIT